MERISLRLVVQTLLIAPIRFYQCCISPMLPAACRYYPSCSSYAIIAIKKHGALWGLLLTFWRIMRCHPWAEGGFDPVPDTRPSFTFGRHQENTQSHGR